MATISFESVIKKLKALEKAFNGTQDPTQRFAIMEAVNYIAEHELPFKKTGNDAWFWKQHYEGMLRDNGVNPKQL